MKESQDKKIFRLIDANLNRVSEGMRVLEDISRYILNDVDLSASLKLARHKINDLFVSANLLLYRNADNDVLKGYDEKTEGHRQDIYDIIHANAKRVQQGLRVLEEISKLDMADAGVIKDIRYKIYDIEKLLYENTKDICDFG